MAAGNLWFAFPRDMELEAMLSIGQDCQFAPLPRWAVSQMDGTGGCAHQLGGLNLLLYPDRTIEWASQSAQPIDCRSK